MPATKIVKRGGDGPINYTCLFAKAIFHVIGFGSGVFEAKLLVIYEDTRDKHFFSFFTSRETRRHR